VKIISLSDLQNTGGASVACNRINDTIKESGAELSSISSDGVNSKDHNVLFLGKKYALLQHFFSHHLPDSLFEKLRKLELKRQLSFILSSEKPSIINVHNLHSADWPISIIKTCLHFAPVVWTLHDCWSFLGSYYPTHSAPQSPKLKYEINRFWESLKRNPLNHPLSAVTPSTWMKNEAQDSHWADQKVETIHNPVPDSFFATRDRLACKKALSINETKTTILCIAGNLDEERKGGPILRDILAEEWGQDVEFILIGKGYTPAQNSRHVKCLGFVRDELTLQIAYYAADILLHPAPIDNLPNTVAESMSCGTPVLAFDTGGLTEMVITQQSGWRVPPGDHTGMISTLRDVLDTKSYSDLRKSSRSTASEKFLSSKVGKKYQDLFISCTPAK
jgi:glycosyltransferase involved in cell wall biosynthesis